MRRYLKTLSMSALVYFIWIMSITLHVRNVRCVICTKCCERVNKQAVMHTMWLCERKRLRDSINVMIDAVVPVAAADCRNMIAVASSDLAVYSIHVSDQIVFF